jgi:hypothetical protein
MKCIQRHVTVKNCLKMIKISIRKRKRTTTTLIIVQSTKISSTNFRIQILNVVLKTKNILRFQSARGQTYRMKYIRCAAALVN